MSPRLDTSGHIQAETVIVLPNSAIVCKRKQFFLPLTCLISTLNCCIWLTVVMYWLHTKLFCFYNSHTQQNKNCLCPRIPLCVLYNIDTHAQNNQLSTLLPHDYEKITSSLFEHTCTCADHCTVTWRHVIVSLFTNASDYSSETTNICKIQARRSFHASLIGVVTGVDEQRYAAAKRTYTEVSKIWCLDHTYLSRLQWLVVLWLESRPRPRPIARDRVRISVQWKAADREAKMTSIQLTWWAVLYTEP